MKCRYCGSEISRGQLYCPRCGRDVRIVPDYNPIEDALEAELKDSLSSESMNRTGGGRDQRRRQEERRKELRRRRNRLLLIIFAALAVIIGLTVFLLYQNSYSTIVKKGDKALNAKDYELAVDYFDKARDKKPKKAPAYEGISKVYIAQGNLDEAEDVFAKAIGTQTGNADLYEAYIQFYKDTEQSMQIPVLLSEAPDSVRESLSRYIVAAPEFSLDEDTTFDSVQQLTLNADGREIYYTTDGSDATLSSEKYTEPIQLSAEGDNVVSTLCVDNDGIPSETVTKTFVIKFPVIDAPSVSPSTGQYTEATQIEIKVPEGYTAYYTTDKSDPTKDSTQYTAPFDMPQGTTLLKAVLVDAKGRQSEVTTRNYVFQPE